MVTSVLAGTLVPSRAGNIAAAILYGISGVAILSLQPLAFGPLAAAGILTESQLGRVAGIETAGLALASAILPGWLSRGGFRYKLAALAAIMMLCNLVTPHLLSFERLLLLRLLCGLAEGGILAGAFVVLFSKGAPDRMNALFLAVSNTVTGTISYLIPMKVLPAFGPAGSFILMAGLGAMALVAVLALSHRPVPMPTPVSGWRTWPRATWFVLLGIVAQNAGVISAWVFLESTARANGYGAQPLALSASLSLFAQVAGATAIASYGYRLPAGRSLMLGGAVLAGAIFWLGHPGSSTQFVVANILMGLCWLALLPLSLKLICEIERKKQAVYLTAAAQMLGLSLGPLLASLFVTEQSVKPAYVVGLTCALLAVALFAVARKSPDRIKRV
jgi:MFS family permease